MDEELGSESEFARCSAIDCSKSLVILTTISCNSASSKEEPMEFQLVERVMLCLWNNWIKM